MPRQLVEPNIPHRHTAAAVTQPARRRARPDARPWLLGLVGLFASAGMSIAPATAAAAPTVAEFTGGVTPGFSANWPRDIAAGPDGNLWFTEQDLGGPGHVGRITPTGTVTEFTGGVTPGFTAMSEPSGIATGRDGDLWFTEAGIPGRIARITPAGTVTEFSSGLTPNSSPAEIAAGPDGNLWFTEGADPGRIGRITPAGVVTEFTGGVTPGFTANSRPFGIVAGPDGNLWFTEFNAHALGAGPGRIARITPAGAVTEFTSPGLDRPLLIAPGPDDNLWFTAASGLGPITPAGVVSQYTYPYSTLPGFTFFSQYGIAAGADGNIWLTDLNAAGGIARISPGPAAVTVPASDITATAATLNGSVRPNGQTTALHFQYGPTTSYGSRTPDAGAGSALASQRVAAAVSGLSPGTTYHFRLVATNDSASNQGTDQTFTTAAPQAPSPSAPQPTPTAPVLSALPRIVSLRISPTTFRAAHTGPSAAAAAPSGTSVRLSLSLAAQVRFTAERAVAGRSAGRRCVPSVRAHHGGRGCTRYVRVAGSFVRSAGAGTNRFRFSGRLAGRALAPGAYRLVAVPSFASRPGPFASVRFYIQR